jgi:DNA-binding NtrC family response regulator
VQTVTLITRRQFLAGASVVLGATAMGFPVGASTPIRAPVAPAAPSPLDGILGESHAIVTLRDSARRILSRAAGGGRLPPVLLAGETGSGKGFVADAMHRARPHGVGAFIPVCASVIPESLLATELFGSGREALPGEVRAHQGLIRAAHHGTLFLEEMEVLTERLRIKVLESVDEPPDVWLVATTLKGVDVFSPRRSIVLRVPPLRERDDDVLLLADHYVARFCRDYQVPTKTLSRNARAALRGYIWPGNVRELINCVERATVLAGPQIEPEDLGLSPRALRSARQLWRAATGCA